MSKLQELSDLQEMEYYAAISDIRNAIEKFGIDVINDAINVDLTEFVDHDILVVH